jgi:hypothetical protein
MSSVARERWEPHGCGAQVGKSPVHALLAIQLQLQQLVL